MDFRTVVKIEHPGFSIEPCERMLFVGSCFAENIGKRFVENKFRAVVNPYGVMYNPASILHTVQKVTEDARVVFLTLGTNHVYILNETGEIVDNCAKRPHNLFTERVLTVEECTEFLSEAVDILREKNSHVHIVVTVSPIRYAKYGYHGSMISKAVLLLAADKLVARYPGVVEYFPAYEIVNDELRDYRFYASDMLHPSEQAVEYIWERLQEHYLSDGARLFIKEWKPLKDALGHKPFNPQSEDYLLFMEDTRRKIGLLAQKYPGFEV